MALELREFLTQLGIPYREKASRLELCCPFHADTNPSAAFYLSTHLFHCFVCELTFDMVRFYAKLKEVATKQAILDLEKMGYDRIDFKEQDIEKVETRLRRIRAEIALKEKREWPRLRFGEMAEELDRIIWKAETGQIGEGELLVLLELWYSGLVS